MPKEYHALKAVRSIRLVLGHPKLMLFVVDGTFPLVQIRVDFVVVRASRRILWGKFYLVIVSFHQRHI